MIEYLQQLDTQFLLALNGLHLPFTDRFMMAFTSRWVWLPMYVALAWFVVRRLGWRNGLITIGGVCLAVMLADQTCAALLRPAFERLRPANLDNPLSEMIHVVSGYRGGPYGFPSCHAANTFALSTYMTLLNRRNHLWIWMFLWALGNCYTRMYLGVHYPGDIIVGAVIGVLISAALFYICRSLLHVKRIVGTRDIWPVFSVAGLLVAAMMIYSIFI